MATLLYFHHNKSTFVYSDLQLLEESFTVLPHYFDSQHKKKTPVFFLLQFLFLLRYGWTCRCMVSQFSGYHSLLPSIWSRVFRKPHYIILHGTECNNFPELNYGYIIRPVLFWFSKKSLQWATRLLPVSESLVEARYTYAQTKYPKQGFQSFYPDVRTPYSIIYNGVSPERFKPTPGIYRRPATFITVATGLESPNRAKLKGLDLVVALAHELPDTEFTFVGSETASATALPSNVRLTGYIPNDELPDLYAQHHFYLQLSYSEGFGIAVVEAMLCGCVPIVSNVGILPVIAGPHGFTLLKKDLALLRSLVAQAMVQAATPDEDAIRRWAIDHYDIELRKSELLRVLRSD